MVKELVIRFFLALVVIPFFIFILSGAALEQSKKVSPLPPHHAPKGFRNLYRPSERGFGDFLRWQLGLGPPEIPPIPPKEVTDYKPEILQPATQVIKQPDPNQLQITWIGHSTFLIQVEGINILTDPQFSDCCGPNSFLGTKQMTLPGVPFEQLPSIHVVVISHNSQIDG